MALTDLQLMAHLFRRAGFGAPRDELEAAVAQSKDAKSRGWLGTLKNIVGKRDSE